MIIKRIAEGVRTQDWFVVTIEVMIVVVGIFIGLQVDDWNEGRKQDTRAQEYITRIQHDLETDVGALHRRGDFWRAVAEYGTIAITYGETGVLQDGSPWQTLLAFYQASQIAPYSYTSITYTEMQSAGELGLIKDIELRRMLASYYSLASDSTRNELFTNQPKYRELIRGKIPSHIAGYIWQDCYHNDGLKNQRLLACASPVREEEAQKILDSLMSQPEVLESLRFWMVMNDVALVLLEIDMASSNKILAYIKAEV